MKRINDSLKRIGSGVMILLLVVQELTAAVMSPAVLKPAQLGAYRAPAAGSRPGAFARLPGSGASPKNPYPRLPEPVLSRTAPRRVLRESCAAAWSRALAGVRGGFALLGHIKDAAVLAFLSGAEALGELAVNARRLGTPRRRGPGGLSGLFSRESKSPAAPSPALSRLGELPSRILIRAIVSLADPSPVAALPAGGAEAESVSELDPLAARLAKLENSPRSSAMRKYMDAKMRMALRKASPEAIERATAGAQRISRDQFVALLASEPSAKKSLRSYRDDTNGREVYAMQTADGSRYQAEQNFAVDPLVFDLDGDEVRTSGLRALFDIDGDGVKEELSDVSAGDGLLVFDADGDGVAGESGLELFGDKTDFDGDGRPDGFASGFEALKALADRSVEEGFLEGDALADGKLDAVELDMLGQAYGVRMKLGGFNAKAALMAATGIRELTLSDAELDRLSNFDGRGNDVSTQEGARFVRADGSQSSYEDVWFRYGPIGGSGLAS